MVIDNYIINGEMAIDQNRNGAIYYSDPNFETYTLDQWRFCGGTSGAGRFTVQRRDIDFNGFKHCLQAASTTQQTELSPTENMHIEYPIEGIFMKDWGFGTAQAKDITVSFWIDVTEAGEYPFAIMNGINTESYVTSFNVPIPYVWTHISITIPGDTHGVWQTGESTFGMKLLWSLGVGSMHSTLETEQWRPTAAWNKTGTIQLIQGIPNSSIYITGVKLELGDQVTPYQHKTVEQDLLESQRYYYKTDIKYIHGRSNGYQANYPTQMCSANAPITFNGDWYNTSTNRYSGKPAVIRQDKNGFFVYNPKNEPNGSTLTVSAVVNSRLGGG